MAIELKYNPGKLFNSAKTDKHEDDQNPKEYKDYVYDKNRVLEIAQKLADKGFFSCKEKWFPRNVHYNVDIKRSEFKFAVAFNREWDTTEVAELIAEIFRENGFDARSKQGWGYVWVKVHLAGDIETSIWDCFE